MTDEQWSELQIILEKRHLERIFKNQRPFLEGRIEEFASAYARRVSGAHNPGHPGVPATASVSDLLNEHSRNAHRVDALLQALVFSVSPEMLAMMWMVLMGAQIEEISYGYSRGAKSQLKVEILLPDRITKLAFHSAEHRDASLLKMMALSTSNGLPVVGDFSPLYVPGP